MTIEIIGSGAAFYGLRLLKVDEEHVRAHGLRVDSVEVFMLLPPAVTLPPKSRQ